MFVDIRKSIGPGNDWFTRFWHQDYPVILALSSILLTSRFSIFRCYTISAPRS